MSEEEYPSNNPTNPGSGGEEAPPVELEGQVAAATNQNDGAPSGMFANMNLMDNDDDDDSDSSSDVENPLSTLPPYVLQRVEKLKELHEKRDQLMEQYLKDRAALEAKYHTLCEPLYEERFSIINGMKDDEIDKEPKKVEDKTSNKEEETNEGETNMVETVGDNESEEEAEEEEESAENETKIVGIPQFWVSTMSHMEPLAELITDEDVDCLEHLQDIACIDTADGTGFTLKFTFGPNDYFHNTVLTKRYEVPNLLLDDEPILKNVDGCTIDWKPDRCLTFRQVTKKQRGTGKNAGMVRSVKKKERTESFFHFFDPPKMPSMETMDEDEADRLEEAFEEDYDVAQAFRSHIIPKAVMWFTGKALEEEMEHMFNDEMMPGDDGAGHNPFPPSAPGERPPECDQQN